MPTNDADTVPSTASPAIANPAPLGLCAFALTTFVLSAANAKLMTGAEVVIGLALFYGGLAQVLAGMWEFKTGNTFGATAFTSYGAFWMAVAATLHLGLIKEGTNGFAFFLLGWTIFTGMLFLCTFRLSGALIALFGSLFLTFILLTAGAFGAGTDQIGGYLGLLTAFIAWYTALAGLLTATNSPFRLPVGPRT